MDVSEPERPRSSREPRELQFGEKMAYAGAGTSIKDLFHPDRI